MLLMLNNTNLESLKKLMAYARDNDLQLSLIDDASAGYSLPGKPLSSEQLAQLIEKSRKSGMLSMKDAHQIARNNYHAD